jgi:hypothetical protein
MGSCPCPRCKITKEELPGLGSKSDMAIRVERVRTDNEERQNKVENARDLIYRDGYVVNSTRVDDLLKSESLVPTTVSR